MKILAIETSGKTFSLAVTQDNKIIGDVFLDFGKTHSERLIPSVEWLLKQVDWKAEDIDKIAVTVGPGSFTGIRVGLTAARILSQVYDIPLVGLDTLEVLRQSVFCPGYTVVSAIDALRGEVYAKHFDFQILNYKTKDKVIIVGIKDFINKLKKLGQKVVVVGSAAVVYKEEFKKELGENIILFPEENNVPKAAIAAKIAYVIKGKTFDKIKPLYIRKSWAEENTTLPATSNPKPERRVAGHN